MKSKHVGRQLDPQEAELTGGSGARVGATPDGREVARADVGARRGGDPHAGGRDARSGRGDDIVQDFDGGISAQPKGGLSGGVDPSSERIQPALPGTPVGGVDGIDPAESMMSVVADPNRNIDEQDARDALPGEQPEVGSVAEDRTQLDEYAARKGRTLEELVPRTPPQSRAGDVPSNPSMTAANPRNNEGPKAKAPRRR